MCVSFHLHHIVCDHHEQIVLGPCFYAETLVTSKRFVSWMWWWSLDRCDYLVWCNVCQRHHTHNVSEQRKETKHIHEKKYQTFCFVHSHLSKKSNIALLRVTSTTHACLVIVAMDSTAQTYVEMLLKPVLPLTMAGMAVHWGVMYSGSIIGSQQTRQTAHPWPEVMGISQTAHTCNIILIYLVCRLYQE